LLLSNGRSPGGFPPDASRNPTRFPSSRNKDILGGAKMTASDFTNKNCVSPFLRRVLSRSSVKGPSQHRSGNLLQPNQPKQIMASVNGETLQRPDSRTNSWSSSAKPASSDGMIDVSTEENVQFMDQPLKGRIELTNLPAPIENITIALKGVVKTCVTGNAAWGSGFGGESNATGRFTEKEVRTPCSQ